MKLGALELPFVSHASVSQSDYLPQDIIFKIFGITIVYNVKKDIIAS